MRRKNELSSETVEQLQAHKRPTESIDDVVQRFVPDIERAEPEQLAQEAMLAEDVIAASEEQLSARAYFTKRVGVDPADYDGKEEFLAAVQEARQ